MSEHSVAQARASVMLYDNEKKQWQPSGGSQGLSRVNVYHHPVNNTFRIVGRKVNDHAVVINCALARGLKYNEATPTFHQWRDQRQVYGLNFQSRDDAEMFGQAVREALVSLKEATSAASAAAPQSYQYYQDSVSNGPAGGQEDMAAHIRQRQAADYDSHDNYSRSRVATGGAQDRPFRPQYDTQGSGGGSETESPSSSQLSVASSVGPTSPIQSAAPPAPTPPPAPPAPSGPAAPRPPQPPPVPGIGAPAPPPPPPAPPAPSAGGGGSLADQIAAAKLRKSSKGDSGDGGVRTERSNSVRGNNSGVGGMDMMAEMQRKLAARRAKQDDSPSTNGPVNQEEKSFPSVRSTTPSNPPSFSSNTNKASFPPPVKMNKSESRFNSTSSSSKSDSSITNEQLEEFKSELIIAFRQELEAYKEEIIEAVRNEVSKMM
ncbi:protein enabled homolog isoform X2 [Actinia tenebrosa]|uniref:Protein enabled homolog isoform X2 n=1 Tax=Actinia tenebrosa TaxID=6105 RepID=A0A6P8IDW8_ACTTE|nr:protein enabled homolog isoform X2 [Actinia tenebrosa]